LTLRIAKKIFAFENRRFAGLSQCVTRRRFFREASAAEQDQTRRKVIDS
jgi:hypothetical protein